jgi:hypothetical protein
MQKEKTKAIEEWPVPQNVKDVQRFMGLANYYRRFIDQFAKIAAPLHALTRKEKIWEWTPKCQEAFELLKGKFSSYPILVNPDHTQPLRIESDTSNFATGAVLSMKCPDDKWRPCAYLSKGLNDVERNYDVHDKEMLGIVRALEAWRHHLEGATHQVEIWTDHKNLKYFMSEKKLNRRQA